jgi:hypothetical protein
MVYQVVDVKTARARGVAAPAEPDENKTNQFTRGDQDQVQDDLLAFQDIPLPLTRPKLSYFLLAVNLSVYTAGIVIALTISADSSNQFFLLLAKSNPEVCCACMEWLRCSGSACKHSNRRGAMIRKIGMRPVPSDSHLPQIHKRFNKHFEVKRFIQHEIVSPKVCEAGDSLQASGYSRVMVATALC